MTKKQAIFKVLLTSIATAMLLVPSAFCLAQDEALISIRSKNRAPPALVFESATLRDFVKYLNVAGVPILLVLAGAVRLWRRKQATRRVYQPLARSEAS